MARSADPPHHDLPARPIRRAHTHPSRRGPAPRRDPVDLPADDPQRRQQSHDAVASARILLADRSLEQFLALEPPPPPTPNDASTIKNPLAPRITQEFTALIRCVDESTRLHTFTEFTRRCEDVAQRRHGLPATSEIFGISRYTTPRPDHAVVQRARE